jgi:hypothetical protein
LAVSHPFAKIWTRDEFGQLVQRLNNRKPSLISIESDDSPLLDAPRREFSHRVRDAITPNFRLANAKNGLEFWLSRPTPKQVEWLTHHLIVLPDRFSRY